MFSLIITIISIALVAALALATLYYGGDAFKRGAASADATKLHVQAQQLQGAAELYKADTGAYPLTMEAMLTGNYLKSIPVSSLSPGLDPAQETGNSPALMAQASAAGVVWKMVLSGYPVFAVTQVSAAVCEAVNMKAYGTAGILKSARAGYATQCFGPDLANLSMVTTKSGAALITASLSPLATVDLGTVLTTAPPAVNSGDTTDAGWLTTGVATVTAVTPPSEYLAGGLEYSVAGYQVESLGFVDTQAYKSSSIVLTVTGRMPGWYELGEFQVPAGFTLKSDNCSRTALYTGNSCEVTIAFAPTAVATYSGAPNVLTVYAPGGTVLSKLPLSGRGTALPTGTIEYIIGFNTANVNGASSLGYGYNAAWAASDIYLTNNDAYQVDEPFCRYAIYSANAGELGLYCQGLTAQTADWYQGTERLGVSVSRVDISGVDLSPATVVVCWSASPGDNSLKQPHACSAAAADGWHASSIPNIYGTLETPSASILEVLPDSPTYSDSDPFWNWDSDYDSNTGNFIPRYLRSANKLQEFPVFSSIN